MWNLEFWKALIEPLLVPLVDILNNKPENQIIKFGEDDVYGAVFNYLPPEKRVHIQKNSNVDWFTAQKSGTCSMSSFLVFLRSGWLGPDAYKYLTTTFLKGCRILTSLNRLRDNVEFFATKLPTCICTKIRSFG